MVGALWLLIFVFVLAAPGAAVEKEKGERQELLDRDKNGSKETRVIYKDGKRVRMAVDKNGDGADDQFTLYLKGRDLVLKEKDMNFDGKIDWRALQQFNPDKKMTIIGGNNRPERIALPGYDTLWKQIDEDFNGAIDVFREKGKKLEDGKSAAGRPIRLKPTLEVSDSAQKP